MLLPVVVQCNFLLFHIQTRYKWLDRHMDQFFELSRMNVFASICLLHTKDTDGTKIVTTQRRVAETATGGTKLV